ncbi:MAG: hypothetical protein Q8R72_00255 [Hylemonella sp.]|nr:hypothetical protein [Hylemonella sp.]
MIFQIFNPYQAFRVQNSKMQPRWRELSEGWPAMDLDQLRGQNAHWFKQPMAFELTAPALWAINQEFTRRGVAPMWRGVSPFAKIAPLPPANMASVGPRKIGEEATRTLMKRWIDLEWLRALLGDTHTVRKTAWRGVFNSNIEIAVTGFLRVNSIQSHGSAEGGGSSFGGVKYGFESAYKVLYFLDIPVLAQMGLTGLISRDAGSLVRNAQKRVKVRIRPRLEELMKRPKFPLTRDEVEGRLTYCEAIELAVGSPTAAVTVYKWITGSTVTKQSMSEMKRKIADQCGLITRAWVGPGQGR